MQQKGSLTQLPVHSIHKSPFRSTFNRASKKKTTKKQVTSSCDPLNVRLALCLKNIQVEHELFGSWGSSEQFKCPDKNRVFFIKGEKGEAWRHYS